MIIKKIKKINRKKKSKTAWVIRLQFFWLGLWNESKPVVNVCNNSFSLSVFDGAAVNAGSVSILSGGVSS